MRLFRVAPEASTARNVLLTLAEIVGMWSTFLAALPWVVLRVEDRLGVPPMHLPAHRATGLVLFVVASVTGLATGLIMAVHGRGTPLPIYTARRLVALGPYRVVRNPMAVTGIAQGLAVGIFHDSAFVVLYAMAGALLWHFGARPLEERDLQRRFGAEYSAYRDSLPLWLPRLLPWRVERAAGWALLGACALLGLTTDVVARAGTGAWPAGMLALMIAALLVSR